MNQKETTENKRSTLAASRAAAWKPLPEPPKRVGGFASVSLPDVRAIAGRIDYDFPEFPESAKDAVIQKANLEAKATNIAIGARSERERLALRLHALKEVSDVFCERAGTLGWGASRMDSELRKYFEAALCWAGISDERGDVRAEVRREVDAVLLELLCPKDSSTSAQSGLDPFTSRQQREGAIRTAAKAHGGPVALAAFMHVDYRGDLRAWARDRGVKFNKTGASTRVERIEKALLPYTSRNA